MGSVKDLTVLTLPTEDRPGVGIFRFSDRYSVFDWGEMPDTLPGKGAALALLGAWMFEQMEARGLRTHYRGMRQAGRTLRLPDLKGPSAEMEVTLVRVIPPARTDTGYDYRTLPRTHRNLLVPLEIIYRYRLPEGSSVFRRLARGELSPADLGLDHPPSPGEVLNPPFLDCSTKLEITDRYLTWDEAARLMGLSVEEVTAMKALLMEVAALITEAVAPHGLENLDGKIELAWDEAGRLMVVDVVGTPDECRFAYRLEGDALFPLSKEILRGYYRTTPWYADVQRAKEQDRFHWKAHVPPPPPLPEALRQHVAWMYQALTNAVTGRTWFDAPSLPEVVKLLVEDRARWAG